jgi:hypothetical protein
MKYLGIYFDSNLSFHKHIEHVTEKSRKMIYMLGKRAKLTLGLGYKYLKTIYEDALVLLMTYGVPVWEVAIKKQRLLMKMQSPQGLINIKIPKAYRTISFEASCMLAGVPPIGIVTDRKTWLYKRKHSTGKEDYEWDKPLPAKERTHPALRADIMETTPLTIYPT